MKTTSPSCSPRGEEDFEIRVSWKFIIPAKHLITDSVWLADAAFAEGANTTNYGLMVQNPSLPPVTPTPYHHRGAANQRMC